MAQPMWEKVQALATQTDFDPEAGNWQEVFKYASPAGNPVTREVRKDYWAHKEDEVTCARCRAKMRPE